MTYIEGFVLAVPKARKADYRKEAARAEPLFKEYGATRQVEAWSDSVPDGKVTDFKRAVQAKDDEAVVFSWIEYPDRATRQAANEKLHSDPRMKDMGANMPFDGQRMIVGGFATVHEAGDGGGMGFTEGMLAPIAADKTDAYREFAATTSPLFREHGASRVVEAIEDDVPDGKVTDFRRAVQAKDGEKVVFSWIEWPSKQARDEGWQKIMADERMRAAPMPFDGQRMFAAGFEPILDA